MARMPKIPPTTLPLLMIVMLLLMVLLWLAPGDRATPLMVVSALVVWLRELSAIRALIPMVSPSTLPLLLMMISVFMAFFWLTSADCVELPVGTFPVLMMAVLALFV